MVTRLVPERRNRTPETRRPRNMLDLLDAFWREPFEAAPFDMPEFPSVNISEDDKNITVEAEVPGMNPEDLDISMHNNNLIIQGEKKFEDEQNKDSYHRIERSYGSFYRTVPLPTEVDENSVKANYKNGILNITLPKTETSRSKKIEIES